MEKLLKIKLVINTFKKITLLEELTLDKFLQNVFFSFSYQAMTFSIEKIFIT